MFSCGVRFVREERTLFRTALVRSRAASRLRVTVPFFSLGCDVLCNAECQSGTPLVWRVHHDMRSRCECAIGEVTCGSWKSIGRRQSSILQPSRRRQSVEVDGGSVDQCTRPAEVIPRGPFCRGLKFTSRDLIRVAIPGTWRNPDSVERMDRLGSAGEKGAVRDRRRVSVKGVEQRSSSLWAREPAGSRSDK